MAQASVEFAGQPTHQNALLQTPFFSSVLRKASNGTYDKFGALAFKWGECICRVARLPLKSPASDILGKPIYVVAAPCRAGFCRGKLREHGAMTLEAPAIRSPSQHEAFETEALDVGFDLMLGTSFQRGLTPWFVRTGFGPNFINLDLPSKQGFFVRSRWAIGISAVKLQILLMVARMLRTKPEFLTPSLGCLLQKQ